MHRVRSSSNELRIFFTNIILYLLLNTFSGIDKTDKCWIHVSLKDINKTNDGISWYLNLRGTGTTIAYAVNYGQGRGKSYLGTRTSRHPNSTSTFQLARILISGDISTNPGPTLGTKPTTTKCKSCFKTLARNHRTATCEQCKFPYHIKCAGITPRNHCELLRKTTYQWMCSNCFASAFPFTACNDLSELSIDHESDKHNEMVQNDLDNVNISEAISFMKKERNKHPQELLMCHLNINSIQNKFEELKDIIHKSRTDVMIVSETKIDSTFPDAQFKIEGFKPYRNDRKKGGGGIMALVSTKVQSEELELEMKYRTLEVLPVRLTTTKRKMIVLCIYRPPSPVSGTYRTTLEEELSHICNWAALTCQAVVIIGDLNLDRLRPDKAEGKLLLDLEEQQGLTCLIKEPTRVSTNKKGTTQTLIDVILTNEPNIVKVSGVYNPELSDHSLVYAFMKDKLKEKFNSKVISFRSYKNLNTDDLNMQLSIAPWHVGEIFDDIDDKVGFFNSLMKGILDEQLPLKKMKVRQQDVPYMTVEWKQAIRAKRKAAKRYDKHKTKENWDRKNKLRNECTRIRRRSIKQYWHKKALELKSNPRDFYKTFTPFFSSKGTKTGYEINLAEDGLVVNKVKDVAELMGDYFATTANNIGIDQILANDTGYDQHNSVKNIRDRWRNSDYAALRQLKTIEVENALKQLNPNKAVGWDLIPPRILKLGAQELAPPLACLYNSIIYQGEWPGCWKRGDWVPIFKKGERSNRRNYRPITILSAVDKVFEKLISNQLSGNFESKLSQNMTAYRKNHGCDTTLMRLTENWRKALDKNEWVGLLSTDMTKAFDSLYHPLLISKLAAYGADENTVKIIKSFLENRENRVKICSTTSSWKSVTRGCPQGSAFGPLLWNIFQNDLNYTIKSNLSMYADDHQIYETAKSLSEVQSKVEESANLASSWYKSNMLQGNHDKFFSMAIRRNADNNTSMRIKVDNNDIESVNTLKLLGVKIDNQLNFKEHIKYACSRASQRVGVLTRLRNLIPTEAKLQLFKAAILPYLTYCHVVWHFCLASDKRKLERVQERGLRAIYKDKSSDYLALLKRAKLPTLENRRLQDIATIMYKVKNKLAPSYITELFKMNTSGYNLRKSDFHIPRINTTRYGKHSLRYLGPLLFNKLPFNLRNKDSLKSFKTAIRAEDLTQYTKESCENCIYCHN